MLGGLFTRNRQPGHSTTRTVVLPPPKLVEPPLIPSQEKRLEKERKWIESISNRNKRSAPPLPAAVEYIKREHHWQDATAAALLSQWSPSQHVRGSTNGSSQHPDGSNAAEHRSLRSTRSTSALASKFGNTLRSTIGRNSKERERQSSSTSSLLFSGTAIPTAPQIPLTPPLLQLSGSSGEESAASFVHVPRLSPSTLLVPPGLGRSQRPGQAQSSAYAHGRPSSKTSSDSSTGAASRLSGIETTKTLAIRLQELEHANNIGLLADDEYRVLRQNLFEKSVGSDSTQQSPAPTLSAPASGPSSDTAGMVHVTGSLLGLSRLNMLEHDTRAKIPEAAPLPAETTPPTLQLPSNISIHSKSRFSLRSARSSITSRSVSQVSRLFRRGASAPAPAASSDSESSYTDMLRDGQALQSPSSPAAAGERRSSVRDNHSLNSLPIQVNHRLGKNASIPTDWAHLQDLHLKETEREAAKLSARQTLSKTQMAGTSARSMLSDDPALEEEEYVSSRIEESSYRTMKRASTLPGTQTRLATPSDIGLPSAQSSDSSSLRPSGVKEEYANVADSWSVRRLPLVDESGTPSLLSIIQPSDDTLDSTGLQEAIKSLKRQNERLLSQFSDLEAKLHEQYGAEAPDIMHLSPQEKRRQSVSASYLETARARRLSLSSSTFSGQGRNSVAGYQCGGVVPSSASSVLYAGSTLSRRPSKGSSIASSSMRRELNSSGSTHPGSMDTLATSRSPWAVHEEEVLTEVSAYGHGNTSMKLPSAQQILQDPSYEEQLRKLREKQANVEERYAARLEYLEAKLKGQFIRERLRR